MKSNLKSYFWKLLVSLLLILFLLRFVNQKEMAELLKNIRWPYLIGYFALNFFDRLIMAYKWKILLDAKKIPCSWEKLIMVYFKGTFLGNLFPTSLGGDAVRAYELSRNTKTGIDVISSIIMERFLGFLSSAVMAIMVIPLLFFFVPDFPRILLWFLLIFLSAGVLFLVLLMRGGGPSGLKRFLAKLPWADKISRITSSFVLYRNHPKALGKFFLWSFGEQLLPILTIFFLVLTLGFSVPFHYLVPIIPIAQFFARIPVSLSGFGIQEGIFITLFSFLGVSTTVAFTLGFVSNLGNIIIGLPGAYFYIKGPSSSKPQSAPPEGF
ncbi:MAG: flippase-like domain-containing protein [Deltaproteobacteria bacterium]|nr:flippase-like domain-containing protein [Deltaproteobacteria bacterium]